MKFLAEFVMRGRVQAMAVAALAMLVPLMFWLSTATVALVTLRRGVRDGAVVAFAALIPAALAARMGDPSSVVLVPGILLLAALLRSGIRWPWALIVAAALGLAFSAGLLTLGSAYLEMLKDVFARLFEDVGRRAAEQGDEVQLVPFGATELAGAAGLSLSVALVLGLMLGRWWQGLLYNPGGFGAEMHALRLLPAQALGLLGVALATRSLGPGFQVWIWIPLVPLVFAGIGLVHALAARAGKSRWLGLFYMALLMLPPLKALLAVLAAADGVMDLRRRGIGPPPDEN